MKRHPYTEEELDAIRVLYPTVDAIKLAALLCRSPSSIYYTARLIGVKKDPEVVYKQNKNRVLQVGERTRFCPGHVPANKGKKQPPHVVEKMRRTMFKAGARPHNYKPVGSERIILGYTEVKISDPNKWKQKHRIVWEQYNGPVPQGYIIRFRDGNRSNIELDNLELVSRENNMRDNSLQNFPESLRRLIQVKGALNRQINKIEKNEEHGNHTSRC